MMNKWSYYIQYIVQLPRDLIFSSIGIYKSCYHFVRAILSVPFCPCHFVQYHFVRSATGGMLNPTRVLSLHSSSISPQHFHSKLKTLLFNKSFPDLSSSHCTSYPVSTPNTIHHSRLTVYTCLNSLDPTRCL